MHVHDNRGEKDEHLLPHDGTIDWARAVKLLRKAGDENLPLVLELKEKTGPDTPGVAEQLETASKAMDRLEKDWRKDG